VSRVRGTSARVVGVVALGVGAALALCLVLEGVLPSSAEPAVPESRYEAPAAGERSLDVVINEVAWMGTLYSAMDEWIELRNNTPVTIPLANWHLAVGRYMVYELGGEIAPYGFYLL